MDGRGVGVDPVFQPPSSPELMRLIDELHLQYLFYGSRKIRDELRDRGHDVGRGRVSTLMRKIGITALYQKPRLSIPHPEHKVYPYLLRGLEITEANQVWAEDICYLPMARGFCYLVAIMTGQAAESSPGALKHAGCLFLHQGA